MTSISSQSEYTDESEIQKMLKLIENDVVNIKKELLAINTLVKDDGPLSMAIKNSTERLFNIATKNGIDVEELINADFEFSATDPSFLNRITSLEVTQQIEQLLKE